MKKYTAMAIFVSTKFLGFLSLTTKWCYAKIWGPLPESAVAIHWNFLEISTPWGISPTSNNNKEAIIFRNLSAKQTEAKLLMSLIIVMSP